MSDYYKNGLNMDRPETWPEEYRRHAMGSEREPSWTDDAPHVICTVCGLWMPEPPTGQPAICAGCV